MKRSEFLRLGGLFGAGTILASDSIFSRTIEDYIQKKGIYKNVIFMVSDGMSMGTLSMADLLHKELHGKSSEWISLYQNQKIQRAIMETASLSSFVTDSAAASSAWGGGARVNNGSLNVGPNGEKNTPILQKFKKAGKSVGCVTTVPVTHATPAGFCVNVNSRGDQDQIAALYLDLNFDVFLGGGKKYFTTEQKDKELLDKFKQKGYHIANTTTEMQSTPDGKKLLGLFADDGLPYSIDYPLNGNNVPTLAEMTSSALKTLSKNPQGFFVQIEAGKVDWAAHGNDIGALLLDQLAFDAAIKEVLQFVKNRKDTLVIITTDHGNSNPGLLYGKKANTGFSTIKSYTASNDWILSNIQKNSTKQEVKDLIYTANGYSISDEDAASLLNEYTNLSEEEIYNPRKLPFKKLAEIQSKFNQIGFMGMDHTSDMVEFCLLGAHEPILPAFIKNYEVHHLLLKLCGIPAA